jgi:hypothetical protein
VPQETDAEVLQRRLADVRRRIAATAEQLDQLKDEEYGISLALARLTDGPVPQRESATRSAGQHRPSKDQRLTPLVRNTLQQSPEPMTRHEIADALSSRGAEVDVNAVSASLSYLRRHGVAVNVGGAWAAAAEAKG